MTGLDLDAIRPAQDARRAGMERALLGQPEPEAQEREVPSFDGGARRDQPPPAPSHPETLMEILATRAGDMGSRWFQ
jgi:hypothetical protein